jgi:hypothetical protein
LTYVCTACPDTKHPPCVTRLVIGAVLLHALSSRPFILIFLAAPLLSLFPLLASLRLLLLFLCC